MGALTHYPLRDTKGGSLTGLAFDEDGALWVVDARDGGNVMGRLTP